MGKLAERYGDAARSGVYRVSDGAIPRAAAAEANAQLLELAASAVALGGLRQALAGDERCILVVLIEGAGDNAVLIEALQTVGREAREAGRRFFAVLIDPKGSLALPPLYKEAALMPASECAAGAVRPGRAAGAAREGRRRSTSPR
jgi:hypothetical protein